MKRLLTIRALMFVILGGVFSASVLAVPVTQSTKTCKPLIDKNKKLPQPKISGLSERMYKRLSRAQERLADSKYDEAIQMLKDLESSARDDNAKATVNVNLAYAHAQKGDSDGSFPYFQKALQFGQGTLPNEQQQNLRMNVAGFLYNLDRKKEAINMMLEWMDNSIVDNPQAYSMLGGLYYENGEIAKSICPAFFAVKTAPAPNKQYYQLLMAAHWEMKDIIGTAEVLKEMIANFPDENDYWNQLSQIYYQLDKLDESLAIAEMLYLKGGFKTDKDYRWLSTLFAYQDVPYRAAKVLEEGMNKGVVDKTENMWFAVANNYHSSHEVDKAITAYGKTAELSDTGEYYLKQAELLSDEERWQEAVTAYNKAISAGKLKEPGKAYFRKGIALVSSGSCESGMSVLEEATKYKNYRNRANQWISYAKERQSNDKC